MATAAAQGRAKSRLVLRRRVGLHRQCLHSSIDGSTVQPIQALPYAIPQVNSPSPFSETLCSVHTRCLMICINQFFTHPFPQIVLFSRVFRKNSIIERDPSEVCVD